MTEASSLARKATTFAGAVLLLEQVGEMLPMRLVSDIEMQSAIVIQIAAGEAYIGADHPQSLRGETIGTSLSDAPIGPSQPPP